MTKTLKKLWIETSLLVSFSFLFLSQAVFAKKARPIAVVDNIIGNAFLTENGKTTILRKGSYIRKFSKIVTEMGSQITINDYFDHTYILAEKSSFVILENVIELQTGSMWIQSSYRGDTPFIVQTSNSTVKYLGGEAIISTYNDQGVGKTTLIVLRGKWKFSNSLHKYSQVELIDQQFSIINNNLNNGHPRKVTEISQSSFNTITGLFKGVSPKLIKEEPVKKVAKSDRGVASIDEVPPEKEKPKIIYLIPDENAQKENKAFLDEFYKKELNKMVKKPKKKTFTPKYSKKSNVKIKFFGIRGTGGGDRVPASVRKSIRKKIKAKTKNWKKIPYESPKKRRRPTIRVPASKTKPEIIKRKKKKGSFHKSMIEQYKKQMRHSNEVNGLIDELKSVGQDYKKSY